MQQNFGNPLDHFYEIQFNDYNNGWLVGYNSGIYHTSDGGSTWVNQTPWPDFTSTPISIYSTTITSAFAVGWNGMILNSSDTGNQWNYQTSNTTEDLWDVFFVTPDTGWVVGNNGTILFTPNGGISWISQSSGTTNTLRDVYFLNGTTGWITGQYGVMLFTDDSGNNWQTISSGSNEFFESIFFLNPNLGWATGTTGEILKYTNTTSINNLIINENDVNVYQKNSDLVFINNSREKFYVNIYSVNGSKLKSFYLSSEKYVFNEASGIYLIEIQNNNSKIIKKIFVN